MAVIVVQVSFVGRERPTVTVYANGLDIRGVAMKGGRLTSHDKLLQNFNIKPHRMHLAD